MAEAPPWRLRAIGALASRQNPNTLIVFFEIPPPYFLEVGKDVGFVGPPTEKSV